MWRHPWGVILGNTVVAWNHMIVRLTCSDALLDRSSRVERLELERARKEEASVHFAKSPRGLFCVDEPHYPIALALFSDRIDRNTH